MLKKLVYFWFKYGSKKEIFYKEVNKMVMLWGKKFINVSVSNWRMLGNKYWMLIYSINIIMLIKNILKWEIYIYFLFYYFLVFWRMFFFVLIKLELVGYGI